jgi:glyoxylase-like metal-dependent hydrolase (beta-lactamase superfamily II)
MKQLLVSLSATICALLTVSAACTESEYPPATVEMELTKVSEHVYYAQGTPGIATDNQGFISNAGVIVTEEGVVLFDALGTPSLGDLLLKKIRNITDKPVVRVITSHYHADHIYGLQVFEEQGAEIWAPPGSEAYLASEGAQERLEERRFSLEPWVNETSRLVVPDRYIEAQESFELGKLRFTLTPVGAAHSDGDLTLYVEPDRVLFSGDIIFEGRVPFLGDANSRHWLDVLKRMESQKLAALVPGHGAAAANPDRAVSETRRYLSFLREKMGESAADLVPFDEAYQAVDWSGFADLPAFAEANRRNAYQVYLSMEAEELSE